MLFSMAEDLGGGGGVDRQLSGWRRIVTSAFSTLGGADEHARECRSNWEKTRWRARCRGLFDFDAGADMSHDDDAYTNRTCVHVPPFAIFSAAPIFSNVPRAAMSFRDESVIYPESLPIYEREPFPAISYDVLVLRELLARSSCFRRRDAGRNRQKWSWPRGRLHWHGSQELQIFSQIFFRRYSDSPKVAT